MSTDERIDKVARTVEAVQAHIDDDLKKEKLHRWIFLAMVGILVVIMFIGFSNIHGLVRKDPDPGMFTPKGMRVMVRDLLKNELRVDSIHKMVSEHLPQIEKDLTEVIRNRAPDLISTISEELFTEMPKLLRELAEEQVVEFAEKTLALAAKEMETMVSHIVSETVRQLVDHKGAEALGDPEQVAAMLSGLVKLELRKKATTPGESLQQQLDASRSQMESINRKLAALAGKKDLSRAEFLTKRLIQAWVSVVDRRIED